MHRKQCTPSSAKSHDWRALLSRPCAPCLPCYRPPCHSSRDELSQRHPQDACITFTMSTPSSRRRPAGTPCQAERAGTYNMMHPTHKAGLARLNEELAPRKRPGRDDIKQINKNQTRRDSSARLDQAARPICIRVFRDNAKQMPTSQRCNDRKETEAVQLGRRGRERPRQKTAR